MHLQRAAEALSPTSKLCPWSCLSPCLPVSSESLLRQEFPLLAVPKCPTHDHLQAGVLSWQERRPTFQDPPLPVSLFTCMASFNPHNSLLKVKNHVFKEFVFIAIRMFEMYSGANSINTSWRMNLHCTARCEPITLDFCPPSCHMTRCYPIKTEVTCSSAIAQFYGIHILQFLPWAKCKHITVSLGNFRINLGSVNQCSTKVRSEKGFVFCL